MFPAAPSALAPFDAVRRRLLRASRPLSGRLAADRDARVALLGTVAVGVSLLLTVLAPRWLLALGPVILGVPHLVSDARYLVVRPGLHRRKRLVFWAIAPLAVGAFAGFVPHAIGLGAGGLVMAAAIAGAGSPGRRVLAFSLGFGSIALTLAFDPGATLVLAHAHNLVGLALWWAWRPRRVAHGAVIAAVVAGVLLLASGAVTFENAAFQLDRLAPGVPSPWGARLVLVFAFLQSVHYVTWLRLVPEDDRPQATPRSFAASWRAVRADFGAFPLVVAGAVALAIAVWGAVDLAAANLGYLRLAAFHGPLELGVAALWWIEGRRT